MLQVFGPAAFFGFYEAAMKDVLVHHRFCLFFAVLAGVEAVVGAVGGHEGAVGAAVDDIAVMQDTNLDSESGHTSV